MGLEDLVGGSLDQPASQPVNQLFELPVARASQVMSSPSEMGMKFTGEGGVKVKDFLRWMDSWFATMGDEFTTGTAKSNTMRVAQIHVACPISSAAGKFIYSLSKGVFWDEQLLRDALIDRFHDAERENQADEDILTAMSALRQGKKDVFKYSGKVLKLLQRRPSGAQHYDRILITYYLDGLTSKRLRDLAILSFRRPDSTDTPFQVVKGVMLLATQLKVKGSRRHGSRHSNDEDEDDDDDDDDDKDDTATSSSDNDSDGDDSDDDDDDDDYYRQSKKKKQSKKTAKAKKSEKGKSTRQKSKEGKSRKGHGDESSNREMRELREMVKDLVQLQKAAIAPSASVVTRRPEADIIPLDTYAVGESYGRHSDERPDNSSSNARRPEYSNRRSQASQFTEYRQGHRWGYPAPYEEGY